MGTRDMTSSIPRKHRNANRRITGGHTNCGGPPPRIVFVDHTSEAGGAELALVRLLKTSQNWLASLAIPPAADEADDVFAQLPKTVPIDRVGPRSEPLASNRRKLWPMAKTAIQMLHATFSLLRTRRVRTADILVANTTRASVYVVAASLIMRKPVFVHIRDMIDPAGIGTVPTLLMKKLVLPHVTGVIANSNASLATAKPHLSRHAVTTVLPSPSNLQPLATGAVRVRQRIEKIGMVARIDPWKGQELLLEAFALTFPRGPIRLQFAGGAAFGHESYIVHLKRRAQELGLSNRVDFLGHISNIDEMLNDVDICVQCSLRPEPLGQNVLQYLAAGKAVIVADEGGPAEWVRNGKNGITFAARDKTSLSDALATMSQGTAEFRLTLAREAALSPGLATNHQIGTALADFLAAGR